MKTTDYEYEPHIKVDAHGDIDAQYYIDQAHLARAEYISELSQTSSHAIGLWLHGLYDRLIGHHGHPSH